MHECSVTKSCPILCNPMDCSPPSSTVHGILQARILQWVAMHSSRGSSQPQHWIHVSDVSCIGRRVLYHYRHLGNPKMPPELLKAPFSWNGEKTLRPSLALPSSLPLPSSTLALIPVWVPLPSVPPGSTLTIHPKSTHPRCQVGGRRGHMSPGI